MPFLNEIKSSLEGVKNTKSIHFLKRLSDILGSVVEIQLKFRELRPYEECDIRR